MGEREMITPRTFIFNVLNGVALAIVVGMIPNAILGELSKYLSQYNDIFESSLCNTRNSIFDSNSDRCINCRTI